MNCLKKPSDKYLYKNYIYTTQFIPHYDSTLSLLNFFHEGRYFLSMYKYLSS